MGKRTSEKRKHERLPVRIRIQYRTSDQFFQDYIQNLSVGGIFIETKNPLSVGTKLKVQFSLPEMEEMITADGVVVHRLHGGRTHNLPSGGMGIQFAELDDNCKQVLEDYVQKNL